MFSFLKHKKPKNNFKHNYTLEDIQCLKEITIEMSHDYDFIDLLKNHTYEATVLKTYCPQDDALAVVVDTPPTRKNETFYTPRLYFLPKSEMTSIHDDLPEMEVFCQHGRKFRKWFSDAELLSGDGDSKWKAIFEDIQN